MLNRLWLAIVTLLALGMAPATPGARASAPVPDQLLRAAGDYAHEVYRATTALDLARALETTRRAPAASRVPAPGGPDQALPVAPWNLTQALLAIRPSSREAPREVRLPHGEHLPYFATAPPVRG